jgi:hypothetical protein
MSGRGDIKKKFKKKCQAEAIERRRGPYRATASSRASGARSVTVYLLNCTPLILKLGILKKKKGALCG